MTKTSNKPCSGDHSGKVALIFVFAAVTVMLGIAVALTQRELETVGDAVCADQGHGPYIELKDGVVRCTALPTGRLDGLRVQAVPS